MNKLIKKIKQLEKKGILSKHPHPLVPFLIAIKFVILAIFAPSLSILNIALYSIASFAFVFALSHMFIHKVLTS